MRVIDASVAAKWFLPEDGSEEALALLETQGRLLAPELIRVEVAAAITRRVRLGTLPAQEAKKACSEWFEQLRRGTVTLVGPDELFVPAVELAVRLRHGLQDCLYLAVAQLYRIPLVTADETLHKRASKGGLNVELLSAAPRAKDPASGMH